MNELLPVVAFLAAFLIGRQSVGLGMAAIVWVGGSYGIIRANFFDVFTYFLYDAAVMGFYLARWPQMLKSAKNADSVRRWTIALICWPLLYFGLGFVFPQHPLIQLVGLRAAIWFVPFILIGTQFTNRDLRHLTIGVATFNMIAFAFGIAEFFLGIDMFYPRNAATELIFRSNDVAQYTAYRIPATFSHSAAYGGYCVASTPILLAYLVNPRATFVEKCLMIGGLLAAMLGVFLCGSRSPVIIMGFMLIFSAVILRRRMEVVLLVCVLIALTIYQVTQEERLQRIMTLTDTDMVVQRVGGSTNLGLLDIIAEYPLGIGLGRAFGTSIPSFLQDLAPTPIGAENEFGRIALEQSICGLFIWLGFVLMIMRKRFLEGNDVRLLLLTLFIGVTWLSALSGTGLLLSIPHTAMLFVYMGIAASAVPPSSMPRLPQRAAPQPLD